MEVRVCRWRRLLQLGGWPRQRALVQLEGRQLWRMAGLTLMKGNCPGGWLAAKVLFDRTWWVASVNRSLMRARVAIVLMGGWPQTAS